MIIEIVLCALFAGLFIYVGLLTRKFSEILDRLSFLALSVKEAEDLANRVDESTGAMLHTFQGNLNDLHKQLDEFKTEYGDAAIEEMKESAKAQKAFADGLNNMMSFGADLYGRGDST
jgi:hypothetical protein